MAIGHTLCFEYHNSYIHLRGIVYDDQNIHFVRSLESMNIELENSW